MTNYVLQYICLIETYIRVRLGSLINDKKKSIQSVDEVDEITIILSLFQFSVNYYAILVFFRDTFM